MFRKMFLSTFVVAVGLIVVSANVLLAQETDTSTVESGQVEVPAALDFTVKLIDGSDVKLVGYQGKVLVVVNVASKCGLTPQYEALQELYSSQQENGLAVLGFPCNQFGGQEPGTEAEIQTFCKDSYDVQFDMFSKVDVNGEDAAPLFKMLTSVETSPKEAGDVSWNFEKFVIDRSGNVVGRFGPRTKPDDEEFMALVTKCLAESK